MIQYNDYKLAIVTGLALIATVILANTTIKMVQIDGVSLEIGFVLTLIGLIAIIVYPFLNNSK